jgi:hypothetical protein
MQTEKLYKKCLNKSLLICSDDLSYSQNGRATY